MSITLILFIIIHVIALGFFVEAMRRIRHRSREYPLEDSRETIPFGAVRLRHVVILYSIAYVCWVLLSLWLYFSFVDPGLGGIFSEQPSLNL